MKPFSKWTIAEVEDTFALTPCKQLEALSQWLNAPLPLILLVTMLAAQKLNHDGKPVYGCYVMGRLWFFVVLQGGDYAGSLAYDATKDEIKDIFSILKKTKAIIVKLITAEQ